MVRLRIPKTTVTDEDKAEFIPFSPSLEYRLQTKVTFAFAFAEGPGGVYSLLCMHVLAELGPNCPPKLMTTGLTILPPSTYCSTISNTSRSTFSKARLALNTANFLLDPCFFTRLQALFRHLLSFEQSGPRQASRSSEYQSCLANGPCRAPPKHAGNRPSQEKKHCHCRFVFLPLSVIWTSPTPQPDISWHNPASVCLPARDFSGTGLGRANLHSLAGLAG